ncbi:cadherin-99C-like [Choristoneura fumiferana]|uniref:cadherin-99C-like n=1 Tax=Choristoneura fumiferana TaxID=7141 RepID=UPI003D1568BD
MYNQLILEVSNLNNDALRRRSRSLLAAIEEKSGLIAGLEKVTDRHYLGVNGTLESDPKGTDVWLYLLDPSTGQILTRDSETVQKAIESGINKAVSARLQSQVSQVRPPLQAKEQPRKPQVAAAPLATALPAALLALAALVLVAASAATIYICASWSRYKRHKEQAVQQYGTLSMSMAPPRPNSGYESSEDDPAPRYETQVLNMAVDDADLQLDFSPNNHAFNIHSVQYLSKDNGERSPTLSETATTARASSVNENGTLNNHHQFDNIANNSTFARNTQTLNRRAPNNHALNNALGTLPRVNNNNVGGGLLATTLGRKINGGNNHKKKASQPIMAYDEIPGLQRASDNDNVTFGKRNFTGYTYDQSPVETTTEL